MIISLINRCRSKYIKVYGMGKEAWALYFGKMLYTD
jgi:hypothetical protein